MKQALMALVVSFLATTTVFANEITVVDAWVKPTIPGTENGAGYFQITNQGTQPVTLNGVSTEVSRASEVHQHVMTEDGMMRMRRVPELVIGSGETVTFQPGGYHVMFFGVKNPFKVGDSIEFQLQFADADALDVTAEVRALH
ncbi:copper chaperone PCu(A)C [Pseudidiomarina sediminum]|uniref:copper chaperone PCu(A)C n=1 Tax=Pseudidiomarina sediminum TaxID=431675 RepID=UPI001C9435AD|nr:copper chaperone PCu(A)C [Pseudidiomarina sediminum]MBY6064826.1 copper chaperone PCu(A)C [Pseudidiomarina sediminum]